MDASDVNALEAGAHVLLVEDDERLAELITVSTSMTTAAAFPPQTTSTFLSRSCTSTAAANPAASASASRSCAMSHAGTAATLPRPSQASSHTTLWADAAFFYPQKSPLPDKTGPAVLRERHNLK